MSVPVQEPVVRCPDAELSSGEIAKHETNPSSDGDAEKGLASLELQACRLVDPWGYLSSVDQRQP